MIWLIYENYFKNKEKIRHLLKEVKWYNWLIFTIFLFMAVASIYYSIDSNSFLLFICYIFFGLISGGHLGHQIKKIKETKFGTESEIYFRKIERLKNYLITIEITKIEQIEVLIDQIAETVASLKISDRIKNIVYKICTIVILPIILIFLKEIISKFEYYQLAVFIFALIFILISLGLLFKIFLEHILDSQYNNMKELKLSLEDIKIILLKENHL